MNRTQMIAAMLALPASMTLAQGKEPNIEFDMKVDYAVRQIKDFQSQK